MFDPLGFRVPFVFLAKEILQTLCRIKVAWEIPPEYRSSWSQWRYDLSKLSSFSVTRSLLPESFGHVVSSQLHHFSDASEVAYGSLCYLRLVNAMGEVHCSFMFAKSRLASEVCINSSFGTIRHSHILASGQNAQERDRNANKRPIGFLD